MSNKTKGTPLDVQDLAPRYGGRVVVITCYINTDEDAEKIGGRVTRSARGIKNNAVITTIEMYPAGEGGRKAWAEIQRAVAGAMTSGGPRMVDVDLDGSKTEE